MRIAGLEKNSFVDYPGKIAAVVFTPGCNMNCFFCHNRMLIEDTKDKYPIDAEEVLEFLGSRKRFLDGVVISGGEPTLQEDLESFARCIKGMGYAVKLDTNGTNPLLLYKLISGGLVDYVAMDLKAPMKRYEEICGVRSGLGEIEYSIDLLLREMVDYEFRTTFIPQLSGNDIIAMAERIKGARLYALQQYRPLTGVSTTVDFRALKKQHGTEYIENSAKRISGLVQRVEIRGCKGKTADSAAFIG